MEMKPDQGLESKLSVFYLKGLEDATLVKRPKNPRECTHLGSLSSAVGLENNLQVMNTRGLVKYEAGKYQEPNNVILNIQVTFQSI